MMKRILSMTLFAVLAFTLVASGFVTASADGEDPRLPPLVNKSKKGRLLITTDVECDDMNGLITTAFFAGDMDIVGVVRSAGEWHWDGDRDPDDYSINLGTTLAEAMQPWITESNPYPWRCRGEEPFSPLMVGSIDSGPRSVTAGSLTHYRDADDNWLIDLWDVKYRAVYDNLLKHDPNYPDPDDLIAVTKRGNCAFESDVRYETPGSELIYNEILKLEDKRPLHISVMGGATSLVRAMLSIYEDYYGTDQWAAIHEHIRTVVSASTRDEGDSWNRTYVRDGSYTTEITNGAVRLLSLFTFASNWGSGGSGISSYGSPDLANAEAGRAGQITATPQWTWPSYSRTGFDVNHFYNGKWQAENIQLNHGPLAAHYYTMLDGQYIGADYSMNAEPRTYQWGRTGIHDQKFYEHGPYPEALADYPNAEGFGPGWGRVYGKYDWTGHQGTGLIIIGSGLGQYTEAYDWGRYGLGYGGGRGNNPGISTANANGQYITGAATGIATPFAVAFWEEIAARADWSVADTYEKANHAPIVTVGDNQKIEDHFVYAAPGGMVKLEAEVSDPDGDDIYTSWWLYSARSSYNGTTRDLSPANPASPKTTFTVPADATPGQYFNFVIQARDNDAPGQPMTRFNQVVVHVVDASDPRVAQYAATTAPTAAAIDAGITVAMAEPVVKGKPGAPATLAAHVSGNTGNAVKMFWRVNGGTFTPANGNSHQLLRTWDLSNYTTNFTIPQGAADGVTIVVELWGGAVGQVPSKYGQVTVQADTSTANDPKITNVTASPNQIVQGEAVDITVAVEGQNLEGRTVTATILGKTAQVVNGTAVVSLTAEDVFEFGLFCTRVEVEGTWIKYDYDPDGFIRAYTRPDDLMSPTVTTEGDNTVIIFSKDTQEFAKTDEWRQYFILDAAFDDAEKAVAIGARTVANDKVSAEGNVITIGEKAYPGQTIKLSGVTLSDLYPGPYTFTLAVSATTAGIAAPEILNIDQGKVLRYGIALGHVSGTNRIELAAKFDNTKLDYAGSVLNLPASLNAEFFGAPA